MLCCHLILTQPNLVAWVRIIICFGQPIPLMFCTCPCLSPPAQILPPTAPTRHPPAPSHTRTLLSRKAGRSPDSASSRTLPSCSGRVVFEHSGAGSTASTGAAATPVHGVTAPPPLLREPSSPGLLETPLKRPLKEVRMLPEPPASAPYPTAAAALLGLVALGKRMNSSSDAYPFLTCLLLDLPHSVYSQSSALAFNFEQQRPKSRAHTRVIAGQLAGLSMCQHDMRYEGRQGTGNPKAAEALTLCVPLHRQQSPSTLCDLPPQP